ncbi:HdeD family acid-resistance protein [Thermococcus sp.]|uniref:HdeD family acid-resistance protein n=1 Tax=Thermococcus sp. TaxID=35749 RepID=UPI00262DC841|nr:DUF308 domain-containing protein [Thermococcus sp.]
MAEENGGRPLNAEEYERYRRELERRKAESLMAHWQWYFLLGVILLILGIVGMGIIPFVTLTTVTVFGVFLIIGGLVTIGIAIFAGGQSGAQRMLGILLSILYLIAGATMIEEPLMSARVLTFILGSAYFIFGIVKVLVGFKTENGGIVVFSGAIDFLLGAMILANWPEWSPWVIGLFVAIELIIAGASFIAMALGGRSMKNNPEFQA